MASLQLHATMESLPSDVLSNIFIRLLAKQLAQMRCVSKSWNALLSQPSFVKSHLHHSIRNNDALLLFFYERSYNVTELFSVHPSRSPHLELTNFIKPPSNLPSKGPSVCGSVNGLVCLYHDSDNPYTVHVHIWNPSLSALKTLPPYSIPSGSHDRMQIYFRFGFDPKSDDYKVVKLAGVLRPTSYIGPIFGLPFIVVKEWLSVEVYSMRKDSWKVITQMFPSHITDICRQDVVCVDGHDGLLHWLCCIGDKMDLETIVAFDLDAETFHEMPFPDSLNHNMSGRINVLGVLGGKVCLMSRVVGGNCEVWVMVKYFWFENLKKGHRMLCFFKYAIMVKYFS